MDETEPLFPKIDPFDSGMLPVSKLHSIYYEQSGNRQGNPVIFLRGGPGRGVSTGDRRFFNPTHYRIILMDQRGAGKSTPSYELRENTTWDLVSDMEKLRVHLAIEKWVVFGGSWGATLALAYGETHPSRVKAMILRGVFACRRKEFLWLYQDGASMIYPDKFERFQEIIPEAERGDLMSAYYRRLTSNDREIKMEAAKTWAYWEHFTSKLVPEEWSTGGHDTDYLYALIECHYFVHGAFLKWDSQLLDNAVELKDIPITIVQGRYDVMCPPETAWLLYQKLPNACLEIVQKGGHSCQENGIQKKLVEATEKYKDLLK